MDINAVLIKKFNSLPYICKIQYFEFLLEQFDKHTLEKVTETVKKRIQAGKHTDIFDAVKIAAKC